jgi:hypothetical protein
MYLGRYMQRSIQLILFPSCFNLKYSGEEVREILAVSVSTICCVAFEVNPRRFSFLFASPLLISVGAGLLFTCGVNESRGRLIGYQIIFGVGIGT